MLSSALRLWSVEILTTITPKTADLLLATYRVAAVVIVANESQFEDVPRVRRVHQVLQRLCQAHWDGRLVQNSVPEELHVIGL